MSDGPEFRNVKCAACQTILQGPAEPNPNDRFTCPSCGQGDTHENIMREVGEYAQEQAAKHLQDSIRGVASRHKWIQATVKPIPPREYRFIVDLEL